MGKCGRHFLSIGLFHYVPQGIIEVYTGLMHRVGQNLIYTTHMTVYLVIPLPNYRIYTIYT